LGQGDIRDAAEKAWCATKRAAEALVLARTGREPEIPSQTSAGLRHLAHNDSRFQVLRSHYNACVKELHVDCFYDGHCEPVEDVATTIRETSQYIDQAETLSGPDF
jgi:hypothetical protein